MAQNNLIAECENRLGYQFADKTLLNEALTHASSSSTRLNSYERLEFLGDSILGFITCDFLFQKFPGWLEGDLTKVKSVVVSRLTCGAIGAELRLADFIMVGKGIGSQSQVPNSLLANAFESIIGAIYLDGGVEAAKGFLLPIIEQKVGEAISGQLETNYKSELQQYAQKRFGFPPVYLLIGNKGPDHDKSFCVAAQVNKKQFPPAWGKNKKEAEQRAAANAIAEIEGGDAPFAEEE